MCEDRKAAIGNDELIEKLHQYAMEGTAEMAFVLGVASGRIRWQEQQIAELEKKCSIT